MSNATKQKTFEELEASLGTLALSPRDSGHLELIVRRPGVDEREVLPEGDLDLRAGLVGDGWISRPSPRTPAGSPNPKAQVTLMNARVIALLAQTRERWPLAGDQLFVDLDLGAANLPAGTRLKVGEALLEITDQPHTGCNKFAARFGKDAFRFVNLPEHKALRLRGANARVIQPGRIRTGDLVEVVRRPGA